MRPNCSVYVDAGYLLASAATRATGTSLRNGIHVNFAELVASVIQQAELSCGLPVLRVHWYDAAKNAVPDAQQERIGELPRVKLRLGRFGVDGQQKGVDLRIGLDLVAHARNGASDVYFLVSGDDDLTEAVEEAQLHGVQVIVLAVPSPDGRPHAVSRHLLRAADDIELMDPEAIDASVVRITRPEPIPTTTAPSPESPPAAAAGGAPVASGVRAASPSPIELAQRPRPTAPAPAPSAVVAYSTTTGGQPQISASHAEPDEHLEAIDAVVTKVLESVRKSATPEALAELARAKPSIPRDIDRALLVDLSSALNTLDLSDPVRFRLRDRFWELLER